MSGDDGGLVATQRPTQTKIKTIGWLVVAILMSTFVFLFLACYIKSMTGGPWKVPLIIAGLITTVGLCAAYWAHSRRIGK